MTDLAPWRYAEGISGTNYWPWRDEDQPPSEAQELQVARHLVGEGLAEWTCATCEEVSVANEGDDCAACTDAEG